MDAFIGTIMGWAPFYAPRGWVFCQGQILSIQQYTAVFALVGTTYGGNGQTTFGLPNLQGRVPLCAGQQPGMQAYVQGEVGGTENITLTTNQMPMHNHSATANLTGQIPASTTVANASSPTGGEVLAASVGGYDGNSVDVQIYGPAGTANTTLQGGPVSGSVAIGLAGGSQPFQILQPFQVIQYIMCLEGIFPPRN